MLRSVLCVPRPPCRPLPASPKLPCPRALLGGRDTSEAPPTLPSYLSWGPLGGDSCFLVCPAWGGAVAPGSHQSQTLGSAAPSTLVWVGGHRGQSVAVEHQEDCLSRGCHRRLGSTSKGGRSPNREGQQHDHPERYIPVPRGPGSGWSANPPGPTHRRGPEGLPCWGSEPPFARGCMGGQPDPRRQGQGPATGVIRQSSGVLARERGTCGNVWRLLCSSRRLWAGPGCRRWSGGHGSCPGSGLPGRLWFIYTTRFIYL